LATIFGDTDYLKMAKASTKEIVDVQTLPLEDILKTENLKGKRALVRMDVEGFEKNITKNCQKKFTRSHLNYTLTSWDTTAPLL